ncbi:hypothetical protein Y1Q_0012200 [Alligator mississippiensis]|uniref:Uncharacterized protein n=1 Tax=Alligator mississippiensis TaxID=8496 RepID=A0A151N586_ALLMI|nr:hypothetical protein Y1Q_0012200 [Alligator mississippiensis]
MKSLLLCRGCPPRGKPSGWRSSLGPPLPRPQRPSSQRSSQRLANLASPRGPTMDRQHDQTADPGANDMTQWQPPRFRNCTRPNRPKTVREILKGPLVFFQVPWETLFTYFSRVFNPPVQATVPCPATVEALSLITPAERFEATFIPQEVEACLKRTRDITPSKDGI